MTLTLLASFIVVLTIPLVIWGLTTITSYDTRSEAANNTPKCVVRFLYVDPNFLEVSKIVSIDTTVGTDSNIRNIKVWANEGNSTDFTTNSVTLLDKSYTGSILQVYEKFKYTPSKVGSYTVYGSVTTDTTSYPCLLSGGASASAKIVAKNEEPKFTSAIPALTNNILKVGDQYNQTITAEDTDSQSSFGYYYAFTPNAIWLTPKITKTNEGTGTKLQITLQGIADFPASYLVSTFVWDGYNGHTKSQSWVINVDQKENDIPNVTVSKPVEGSKFAKNSIIQVEWSVKDFNLISKYKLFISANPGNKNSWIAIDQNIGYDYGKYLVDTSKLNLTDGEYYFIVQAVDNQTPSAIGNGLSGKFVYGNANYSGNDGNNDNNGDGTDDGVQIKEAQIINLSPADKSSIKNKRTIIRATLVSGEGAVINKDSIKFTLNDKDLSSSLQISQTSDKKFEVLFSPTEDLPEGSNSVNMSFEDSKGNTAEKGWMFTIEKTDNATINIFGYDIPIKNLIIGTVVALGIIILVIVVPWLFYAAFSNNKKDDYDIYPTYTSTKSTTTSAVKTPTYSDYFDNSASPNKTAVSTTIPAANDYSTMGYTKDYASKTATSTTNTTAYSSDNANTDYTTTVPTSSSLTPVIIPTSVALKEEQSLPLQAEYTPDTQGPLENTDTTAVPLTYDVQTSKTNIPPANTEVISQPKPEPEMVSQVDQNPLDIDFTKYPWVLPTQTIETSTTTSTSTTPAVATPAITTATTTPAATESITPTVTPTSTPVSTSSPTPAEESAINPVLSNEAVSSSTMPTIEPAIIKETQTSFPASPTSETTAQTEANAVVQKNTSTEVTPTTLETNTQPYQQNIYQDQDTQEQVLTSSYVPSPTDQTVTGATTTSTTTIQEPQVQTEGSQIDPALYYQQFQQLDPVEAEIIDNNQYQIANKQIEESDIEAENTENSELDSLSMLAEELANPKTPAATIYDEAANNMNQAPAIQNVIESTQTSTPIDNQAQSIDTQIASTSTSIITTPIVEKSQEVEIAQNLGYQPDSITPNVDPQTGPNVVQLNTKGLEDTAPPPTTILK